MDISSKKNLKDCIVEVKYQIFIRLVINIILGAILIYTYINDNNKNTNYFIILFMILIYLSFLDLPRYIYLKMVLRHIKNRRLSGVNCYPIFWNNSRFILTKGYIFISRKLKIEGFSYFDIKKLEKRTVYNTGGKGYSRQCYKIYLYFTLKNDTKYKTLLYDTAYGIYNEQYDDAVDLILEKNNDIKFIESEKTK